ncbi:MAG TPA: glycolate oxidase subunit GlcF [Thiotrichaceae bacterium]|jgi:glycolate oxidase iron-sulfur subunit|nr:glycolate oxidase subunit GlcF [Thiotrichaceae bacterium]HIM08980.1 glycolate oxidase subunit GlcF [Gammaproteobacteria bacterium]
MQTFIEQSIRETVQGKEAERILRSCVHCGFCTATCPTYQLLADELDGPRGRIYLIKSMLEGEAVSDKTMQHLDRCLTCRACETTCPSGVEYGKLLDIGRHYVEKKVSRSWHDKSYRFLILQSLPYRKRFKILFKLGLSVRIFLPGAIQKFIPVQKEKNKAINYKEHQRKVILFGGCVQPTLSPEINQSVKKVLNYFDVSTVEFENEQCCGAMSHHLDASEQALEFMRKNIDLFWPAIEQGLEAIISSASGCGVHLKEYGYLLRDDKAYASKAEKVSGLTKDISEFLQEFDLDKLNINRSKQVAFQSPCTLQHGQKLDGVTEKLLKKLGFILTEEPDSHLCCGSAGTYSLLEKDISNELQKNKIHNLMQGKPEKILTANIGCCQYLQQVSPVPVRHWIEELADLID